MTVAAKQHAKLRKQLYPKVLEYLNTRSNLRFTAHPRRLKAAAKQICMNIVAAKRRYDLANLNASTARPA